MIATFIIVFLLIGIVLREIYELRKRIKKLESQKGALLLEDNEK